MKLESEDVLLNLEQCKKKPNKISLSFSSSSLFIYLFFTFCGTNSWLGLARKAMFSHDKFTRKPPETLQAPGPAQTPNLFTQGLCTNNEVLE